MSDLRHRIVDGDELIVHGEGSPFLVGPAESGPYTLTPFQFALLLDENKFPDLDINICLLSCNSATEYNGNNYACDTSKALNVFFRYNFICVTGYTGFIEVKSNAKFAVSSVLGRSTKGTHADLDSAKIVYKNGRVCFRNKIMINTLSMMQFSWAQPYILQTNRERRLIETIEQAAVITGNNFVRRSISQDTSFNIYGQGKSNSCHFFPTAPRRDKCTIMDSVEMVPKVEGFLSR